MVRQWQDEFYNQRYSHSLLPCQPDFVALANAYGIKGVRIDDTSCKEANPACY